MTPAFERDCRDRAADTAADDENRPRSATHSPQNTLDLKSWIFFARVDS
jgi:hypothetical protein